MAQWTGAPIGPWAPVKLRGPPKGANRDITALIKKSLTHVPASASKRRLTAPQRPGHPSRSPTRCSYKAPLGLRYLHKAAKHSTHPRAQLLLPRHLSYRPLPGRKVAGASPSRVSVSLSTIHGRIQRRGIVCAVDSSADVRVACNASCILGWADIICRITLSFQKLQSL